MQTLMTALEGIYFAGVIESEGEEAGRKQYVHQIESFWKMISDQITATIVLRTPSTAGSWQAAQILSPTKPRFLK